MLCCCDLALSDDLRRHVVGGTEHVVQALRAVVHLASARVHATITFMHVHTSAHAHTLLPLHPYGPYIVVTWKGNDQRPRATPTGSNDWV